jgi:hypothetical protein
MRKNLPKKKLKKIARIFAASIIHNTEVMTAFSETDLNIEEIKQIEYYVEDIACRLTGPDEFTSNMNLLVSIMKLTR